MFLIGCIALLDILATVLYTGALQLQVPFYYYYYYYKQEVTSCKYTEKHKKTEFLINLSIQNLEQTYCQKGFLHEVTKIQLVGYNYTDN